VSIGQNMQFTKFCQIYVFLKQSADHDQILAITIMTPPPLHKKIKKSDSDHKIKDVKSSEREKM